MRKTLLLLLSLSLGLVGSGSNELFAKPGYFKADPVLSNIGSKSSQGWFIANTVFAKFKAGVAVAPPTYQECNSIGYKEFADPGTCQAQINFQVPFSPDGTLLPGYPRRASNNTTITTNPASFPLGRDTIVFTWQNADGTSTCKIPVEVIDRTAPVLSGGNCGDTLNLTVNTAQCYATGDFTGFDIVAPTSEEACSAPVLLTYTVRDARGTTIVDTVAEGGNILDTIRYNIGYTTITFIGTDRAGLSDTCYTVVRVTDNTNPVFTTSAANDTTLSTNAGTCTRRYGIISPTASDNCGTPVISWTITHDGNIIGTGFGNIANFTFPQGTSTIEYTATDGSGNTVVTSTTVTVVDNERPVVTGCPSDITFRSGTSNNGGNDCISAVSVIRIPGNDNCTPSSGLLYNYEVYNYNSTDTTLVTTGTGDVDSLPLGIGTYFVVYTITDANANVSLPCTVRVNVVDDERPVFTSASQADFTVNDRFGICGYDTIIPSPNVTDNCGSATLSYRVSMGNNTIFSGTGPIPSETFPIGISTLVWTVTDASGNVNRDTLLITVRDTIVPTINAGDDIFLTANGSCTATIPTREITFGDNCPFTVSSITASRSGLSGIDVINDTAAFNGTFPVGTTNVIFTATDASGNIRRDTLTIVVTDDTNPTINNFTNIVESADENCEFVRSFNINNDFNPQDNCGINETFVIINGDDTLDQSFGPLGGTFTYAFPRGITTVRVVTTDNGGNEAFDDFTVNITDRMAPVVFFQDTVRRYLPNSTCTAALVELVLTDLLVEDNCTGSDYLLANAVNNQTTHGDTATAFYNIGTTNLTWTIVDEAGNVSFKNVVIIVSDSTPPTDAANVTINVFSDINRCSAKVKVFSPNSLDNCGIKSVQYRIDGGALVNDSVIDDYSFHIDTNIVEWITTDSSDNVRIDTTFVIVKDAQAPTLGVPSNTLLLAENGCVNDTNFVISATDNCDNLVASSVQWSIVYFSDEADADGDTLSGSGFNISAAGGFRTTVRPSEVYVTATDRSGNTSNASFFVTVRDNVNPVVTCPGDRTFDADVDTCGKRIIFVANNALLGNTISDNCGIESITGTVNGSDFNPTLSRSFAIGTSAVTITITDVNGNSTTCAFNVTVGDVNGPAITSFPNDTVVDALTNECSRLVFWNQPTVNDACTGNSFTIRSNRISGDEFTTGVSTVTYTFTDQNGNVTTRSFTITVRDRQKPEITSVPTDTVIYLTTSCEVTFVYNINAQDNCGGAGDLVTNASVPSGTRLGLGEYNNNIVVTDSSGNFVTAAFHISVRDTSAPIFTEFPENYVTCDGVLDFTVSSRDNCEPITYTYAPYGPGDVLPNNDPVTIIVTATDKNGNVSTRSFTVTRSSNGTVADAGADFAICNGGAITLNGNAPAAGENVTWTALNGAFVVSRNTPSTTVNYSAPGIYSFEYMIDSDGPCPASTDIITVTINTPASVSAGADQNVTGSTTMLNAQSGNNASGVWTVVAGSGNFSAPNSTTTEVSNIAPGNNTYRWTVEVPGCGSVSDDVTVVRGTGTTPSSDVPNTFTPNGDDDNDRFDYAGFVAPGSGIIIYNRWGHKVFESTNGTPWDGRAEDGKLYPVGTYYYVIDQRDGSEPLKGFISLIR